MDVVTTLPVAEMLKLPNESQLECLEELLKGLHILAILPTGLGKSEMVFMYFELMLLVSLRVGEMKCP